MQFVHQVLSGWGLWSNQCPLLLGQPLTDNPRSLCDLIPVFALYCVVLVSRRENGDICCKNGLPTSVWPLLQPQSVFSHSAFLPRVLVWVPGYLLLVFRCFIIRACAPPQTSIRTWTEKGEVTKIEKEEKLYKLSLNLGVNFFIISHILIYNLITKIKGKKLTSEGQSQGATFY